MSEEWKRRQADRTVNGRLNALAQNAVMLLATRVAILALAGFVTWYGTKLISSFEALALQTTELARVVAVMKSEAVDRDRRLDRLESTIDRSGGPPR